MRERKRRIRSPRTSGLEIDLLSEPGVQLYLEPLHLLPDGPELVLELARLLIHSCRRRLEHLLRVIKR